MVLGIPHFKKPLDDTWSRIAEHNIKRGCVNNEKYALMHPRQRTFLIGTTGLIHFVAGLQSSSIYVGVDAGIEVWWCEKI